MNMRWLVPLRWVSAIYYAFSAYMKAELGQGTIFACDKGLVKPDLLNLVRSLLPNTSIMRNPIVTSTLMAPGADCIIDSSAVLRYYGITSAAWAYILPLLGYLVLLHIATFAGLLLLAKKERR